MRQLFLDKGNLVVKEVAQPLLNEYSVLVSVHYAYIYSETNLSNVDIQESFLSNVPHKVKRVLEAVAWQARSSKNKKNTKSHTLLGYSCSGRVVSVGKKVTRYAPGDYVACIDPGYSPHTDLICVPEQCMVKITDQSKIKEASITTLAACGMQALRRAKVQIGERVCIFGLDIVGLLMVQLAKLAGCTVVGIDTDQSRLTLAQKLGADAIYNSNHDEIERELDLLTERHGIDASFVASSSKGTFLRAARVTREKGKVVLLQGSTPQIDELVWEKDIDILLSNDLGGLHPKTSFADMRWTDNRNMFASLALIESGQLDVSPFIVEQATPQTVKTAAKRIKKNKLVGMVFSYGQSNGPYAGSIVSPRIQDDAYTQESVGKFVPAVSDALRVGVVGAGMFAQNNVFPYLEKSKHVSIAAVADIDAGKSRCVAEKYDIKKAFSKHDELFNDDAIDVVVVSSGHTFHADHALRALQKGKAVLVEKPMVTDFSQLQRIYSFLKKHPETPFAVDYGLTSSLFVQKIKAEVDGRKTPLIAQYRINRELSQDELRLQNSMGAGRIIGDTCQIVDLFCYLTQAHPVSISVEAMHSSRDDIFPTDNVSTQISFSDGSVCSLLYTTLGNVEMGTDRMELFYDGKSILMQDYTELYGFGLSSRFNETLSKPDRGYEAFMSQFFDSLKQPKYTPLVDLERLHMVAEITLLIDKLACEGGGKKEM
jgi:predicted dehydrogenase/threonine dehydrogenase-like Zn-dependent dehydrogenase